MNREFIRYSDRMSLFDDAGQKRKMAQPNKQQQPTQKRMTEVRIANNKKWSTGKEIYLTRQNRDKHSLILYQGRDVGR